MALRDSGRARLRHNPAPAAPARSDSGRARLRHNPAPAAPARSRLPYRPLLAVGVAVVALVALVPVAIAAYDPGVRASFRTPEGGATASASPAASAPGVAMTGGAAGPAPQPATSGAPDTAGGPGVPSRPVSVRYRFDGGVAGGVRDAAGLLPLQPREAAGGRLATTPRGGGLAVRFPGPCASYGSESCARAILQSGPADFLNPGRSPFRYGAAVRMAAQETSKGANVVQKGYALGNSQYKLQVDGTGGRPSCVLVGVAAKHIYLAESSKTVADGQWHEVECARRDGLLTLAVDGLVRGRTNIPPELSIVNTDPLCIGGKGTGANNDQFTGAIDDVFVALEP